MFPKIYLELLCEILQRCRIKAQYHQYANNTQVFSVVPGVAMRLKNTHLASQFDTVCKMWLLNCWILLLNQNAYFS